MSRKSEKIAAFLAPFQGRQWDPHYLAYFDCFNQQLFYEAHEVLEELWLARRGQPEEAYYKGLIQLAGAFVHLQKNRLRPAAALLMLARTNLARYAPERYGLDVGALLELVHIWLDKLEGEALKENPLASDKPRLQPPRESSS